MGEMLQEIDIDYDKLIKAFDSQEKRTYAELLIIRKFEENLLKLFEENKLFGTTHTCIGQEAIAVSVMKCIDEDDIVFSNHRCHGHFISYSHRPELLLKEIMGKMGSVCEGRGGSQHIHYKNFYTNGVQGGIVPNAVGAAWAEKIKKTSNIAVVFLGDGTLGQGIVYESLNIASLKEIPVLFIVEDNGYAMSTATIEGVSGNIADRPRAFSIETNEIDGNDIDILHKSLHDAVSYVRTQGKPYMIIARTYRLAAHSKGDDHRDSAELEFHRQRDPIKLYGNRISQEERQYISEEADKYIQRITLEAEKEEFAELSLPVRIHHEENNTYGKMPEFKRYVEYINYALDEAVESYNNVILMGEDIRDPYGGAFKATKGISRKHSDKIYNMPISEAAMVGISVGLALNGIRPVTEIMFGDFVTLTMDQLVNHASKYRWIYGDEVSVPIILRTPMGGRRGYGPTHSQSLEKYLVGIPDINVVALSILHNPIEVYRKVLEQSNPTVIIENKLLYSQKLKIINNETGSMVDNFYVRILNDNIVSTYELSLNKDFFAEVTLVTFGGQVEDCMDAAVRLMIEDEIEVNVIVLGQLSELPWSDLEKIVTSRMVITVEEGTISFGIGAEIIAGLQERKLGEKYYRIASPDVPIPNSLLLEKQILPDADTIIDKVRMIIDGN